MNKNKIFIIGVVVIVLGLLIFANAKNKKSSDQTSSEQKIVQEQKTTATPTASPTPTQTATPTKTVKKKLPYGEALIEYTGRIIQLDQSCNAIPSNISFKNPVTLMLDNRSSSLRKIILNSKTYSLPAYDYITVTLNEKNLPTTTFIDCDNRQNVGRIDLQK